MADNSGFIFNTSKYEVVLLRLVADFAYSLGNSPVEVSKVGKYLIVLLSYFLKSYSNCDKNAFRAKLALVTFKSFFGQSDNRMSHLIFKFYSASFRVWKAVSPRSKGVKIYKNAPRNQFSNSTSSLTKSASIH